MHTTHNFINKIEDNKLKIRVNNFVITYISNSWIFK